MFPSNFFPELDFSIFETLEQFAAVIKRDFEEKAPSETDIVASVDAKGYAGRYDLLRDLALNLFWVNRYAMTMYEKRPTRWRDVPAPPGTPPDIEWVQTYASGPMSEVDSIIWPNPEFDNNITVYGPQVIAVARRYLTQMIDELRGLPRPDGVSGSLLDSIDLIVPHQANKTMVLQLAEAAGVGPKRLYFDIEKVGNTSSASIPIAIQDAVREGVIDRPMRIFAPGFGAGAVAGYVVARIDPAIVAV